MFISSSKQLTYIYQLPKKCQQSNLSKTSSSSEPEKNLAFEKERISSIRVKGKVHTGR